MKTGAKKILAIALEGGARARASATWTGDTLLIGAIEDIKGHPEVWLKDMIEDINAKVQGGWVVMVEDRTFSFPSNAISYNFDDICTDGRTNLQCCLDWYFDLLGRGAVVIVDAASQRYALKQGGENSIFDRENDTKGRVIYNIQWDKFTAGHKALLMCVAGAVMEEPLSERWMRVFSKIDPPEEPPTFPIFKAMKQWNKDIYESFEAGVEALETQKKARRYVRH